MGRWAPEKRGSKVGRQGQVQNDVSPDGETEDPGRKGDSGLGTGR